LFLDVQALYAASRYSADFLNPIACGNVAEQKIHRLFVGESPDINDHRPFPEFWPDLLPDKAAKLKALGLFLHKPADAQFLPKLCHAVWIEPAIEFQAPDDKLSV